MRVFSLTIALLLWAPACQFDLAQDDTVDVELNWRLTLDGTICTCGDVGAESTRVDIVAVGGMPRFVDWFACDELTGTARLLPAGEYLVTVRVEGAGQWAATPSAEQRVEASAPTAAAPIFNVPFYTYPLPQPQPVGLAAQ